MRAPRISPTARAFAPGPRIAVLASALVIFGVGFSLRLLWARYSPATPNPPRFDDSVFYYNMARNLNAGIGYTHPATGLPTAQWPPGYPAFLAAIFSVTGPSQTAGEIANALLGGATAVVGAALAWLLFGDRRAAAASGMIVATAPGSILMAGILWSETLFTFLFSAALLLSVVAVRKQHGRVVTASILALVVGIASLTREAGLVLLPVVAIYWLSVMTPRRDALRHLALVAMGTAAIVLPWTVRNAYQFQSFVLVSSSAGGNFWEGHHATTNGRPAVDIVAKYGPLTRPGGEIAVSRGAMREGLAAVAAHPLFALGQTVDKTIVLYDGDEAGLDWNDAYGRLPFLSLHQRESLRVGSDVAFFVLLMLAVAGVIVGGVRSTGSILIVACVSLWTLGHVAFFTDARFHLPLIPVFACAAGLSLARGADGLLVGARLVFDLVLRRDF